MDAVTLNPLLGSDSVAPFLQAAAAQGAGCFVLVRTSNPSAAELQDLPVQGRPLHEHVAKMVHAMGREHIGVQQQSAIGAVVGGAIGKDVGDRDITTAAGAAAGALIGRKIQERIQENNADQRTTTTVERRCGPPGWSMMARHWAPKVATRPVV